MKSTKLLFLIKKKFYGINMKSNLNSFSLLEVSLVLFLSSLLFTIIISSITQNNRLLNKIQSKLGFEEQMIIFFLQLEEDFF